MAGTRTVNAAVQTAAEGAAQEVWYAVEIGYGTPVRLTTRDTPLIISGDTYLARPGALEIGEMLTSNDDNSVSIRVFSRPGVAGDVGTLDLSEGTNGNTLKVYEVWVAGGTEYAELRFEGVVVQFSGSGNGWCSISGRQNAGARSRPGNRVCYDSCGYEFVTTGTGRCAFDNANDSTTCSRLFTACRAKVRAPAQSAGSGLDDLISKGPFTGSAIRTYTVYLITEGTPDTFKWKRDNGLLSAEINITGDWQALDYGVQIKFAATTGHTATDEWEFQASNEDRFGGFRGIPQPGDTWQMGDSHGVVSSNGWSAAEPPAGGGDRYAIIDRRNFTPASSQVEIGRPGIISERSIDPANAIIE